MIDNYRGGYTKALLDVKEIIQDRSGGLVFRRILTKKAIRFIASLIDAMIANKDIVMEYGSAGAELIQRPDGTFLIQQRK